MYSEELVLDRFKIDIEINEKCVLNQIASCVSNSDRLTQVISRTKRFKREAHFLFKKWRIRSETPATSRSMTTRSNDERLPTVFHE